MSVWLLKPLPSYPITYGDSPENQWRIAGESLLVAGVDSETDARRQADNFKKNTGTRYFAEATSELEHYIGKQQVYFALIEQSEAGTAWAKELLGEDNIDWLKVKEYEVVKKRKEGEII